MAGVVLAAGMRPCAGAIVVLVFAVSQGGEAARPEGQRCSRTNFRHNGVGAHRMREGIPLIPSQRANAFRLRIAITACAPGDCSGSRRPNPRVARYDVTPPHQPRSAVSGTRSPPPVRDHLTARCLLT